MELPVGEKGYEETGNYLPQEALDAIEANVVAIKGPLTTPVGKGIRSLNVAIRQKLDLYACVRPVRYIETVPSPMKHPEKIDMVVFRENTEDLYAGIEWASGTDEANTVADFFKTKWGSIFRQMPASASSPSARPIPNAWWPEPSTTPWRTVSPV